MMANALSKLKSFVIDKNYRTLLLAEKGFFNGMDDEKYLRLIFNARMGHPLNLENPVTFNEKLQWLKLHDRNPIYPKLVDKYEVKKYVAEKIGEQYVIPTLGVWNKFEDINFDELNYEIDNIAKVRNLPERKVVKSTTSVTIEEKPLNPISKYDIGIKTTTKGDNCSMTPIIKSGTKLPCMSETLTTYNYSDHRDNILLTVLYDKKGEKKLLTEKAITEITANRTDWELTITVQFNLLQNGDLLAEIRCVETGKLLRVSASNPDFVDYEE